MYKPKDDILSSSQDNSDTFACRKQFIQTIKFECQLFKFNQIGTNAHLMKSSSHHLYHCSLPPTLKNISRNYCKILWKNLGGAKISKNVTGTYSPNRPLS